MNRVPWQSSAFAQRGMLFNMQYYVGWEEASQQTSSVDWINQLQTNLNKYLPLTAYINYIDMDQPDWPETYYTGALQRLQAVKAMYDPEDYFSFPQSIPLPKGGQR